MSTTLPTSEIKVSFLESVSALITGHPAFPALKAMVDRYDKRHGLALDRDPEGYLTHIRLFRGSYNATWEKQRQLQWQIWEGTGLPRESPGLRKHRGIDWRAYAQREKLVTL